jgi:branched-chain amino acid transport system permease protein
VLNYISSYLVMACIYAIMALALNLQWGFTGLMNFGIGAFYMLGAYTSAILTGVPTVEHLGGFALPIPIGIVGAALLPGAIAYLLSFPALKLRGGPFAIALLAIQETLFLIVKNESWLTNGVWGIRGIPRPFFALVNPRHYSYYFLIIAAVFLVATYLALEKAVSSPWGRVLRGIREDETLTAMSGKDCARYRRQVFVFSSMIMGMAGALYVHYTGFVSPQIFSPLMSTFIVWLMVMVGGTGNNRGVILGAFLVWAIWVGSDFITDLTPPTVATRIGFIRMLAVGLILGLTILTRPQGILTRRMSTLELGEQREGAQRTT